MINVFLGKSSVCCLSGEREIWNNVLQVAQAFFVAYLEGVIRSRFTRQPYSVIDTAVVVVVVVVDVSLLLMLSASVSSYLLLLLLPCCCHVLRVISVDAADVAYTR